VNQEKRNEFKSPDIVTVIKGLRFEWLGHVVRTDSVGTVQRLLGGKLGGRRKRGRPRIRWKDNVQLDLNKSVKRWRTRALDRTEWHLM
jgi:hypothetical protein